MIPQWCCDAYLETSGQHDQHSIGEGSDDMFALDISPVYGGRSNQQAGRFPLENCPGTKLCHWACRLPARGPHIDFSLELPWWKYAAELAICHLA
jgi:hypothetical protein